MTQWTNTAPNPHNNVSMISHNPAQYSGIPNFKQQSGVINGTSPTSFKVTAPTGSNFKKVVNELPTLLTFLIGSE